MSSETQMKAALEIAKQTLTDLSVCVSAGDPDLTPRCFHCDEFMDLAVWPAHGNPKCVVGIAMKAINDALNAKSELCGALTTMWGGQSCKLKKGHTCLIHESNGCAWTAPKLNARPHSPYDCGLLDCTACSEHAAKLGRCSCGSDQFNHPLTPNCGVAR